MKTIKIILSGLILFMIPFGISRAQNGMERKHDMKNHPGYGMGKHAMIPDLTEDQENKIKDLRLALQKEIQPLQNQLGELKARQKTLASTEKPDLKAIDSNIDEISKVQNQLMKASMHHRLQVRNLLTDEQKVFFDAHGKRNMAFHQHKGHFEN